MTIETDPDNWSGVADLTVREIERRSLLGDMAGAQRLVEALAGTAGGPPGPLYDEANAALDTLAHGSLVRHVITQFRKASDAEAQSLTRMCQAIGPRLVLPFAEALSTEDHTHTIRRIRELLISFGAEGRRAVEPLKNSTKPAVRRTAVDLLRIFGGNDALRELSLLLNDADPQVQRDAVRAIVQIGTPEAFAVIDRGCEAGGAGRELIVREVIGLRDSRAVPSLAAVLATTAPRGALVGLHEAIIDALAGLGAHTDSTTALRAALERGEWWAPRRTALLRKAAAAALKRIGSPETLAALEEATRAGSRGVRNAARLALGGEERPMTGTDRAALAEEIVRRLAAALRGGAALRRRAPAGRAQRRRAAETLTVTLANLPSITIGIVGDDLVVGDYPIPRAAETLGELMRRLKQSGIERIAIQRGVEIDEIERLIASVASGETGKDALDRELPHVRVGRIEVEERIENVGDMATFQQLYADASHVASVLWESAAIEGKPDADAARNLVDSLAQAVAQNRTALLALTALKNYDNYTFTHMVNVSILTMGQARGLGIDGPLLREFGLAALMHDIGKVKTPNEVLNKPGKLTDAEFDILKRHTVDGAEILKNTPEIPAARPHRRLRASSPERRHRLSDRRRASPTQSGHDVVRHCRRLRRDALAARLPAGAPDRSHPGGAAAQRRQAVRPASGEAVRPAGRDLSRRQPCAARHRRDCRGPQGVRARSVPAARQGAHAAWRPETGASLRREPVGRARRPAPVGAGAGGRRRLRPRAAVVPLAVASRT